MIHLQRIHQTNLNVRPTTLSLVMEFRKSRCFPGTIPWRRFGVLRER